MMRFKSFEILRSLTLGLALIAALTGCFKPSRRDGNSSHASFVVDDLKGKATLTHVLADFSIPKARDINFAICVKNMRSNEPVKGHKFSLEGSERALELISGDDGCLRWNERISFNFLGDEKFVAFQRTITAKGMESGSRQVRFAVNPWDDKADVIDLTDGRNQLDKEKLVDEVLAVQALQAKGRSRPLLTDSVQIRNRSGGQARGGGINRVFSVWFKSYLQRTDINGAPLDHQLKAAKLKVRATLLMVAREAGVDERSIVWKSENALPVSLQENGVFKVDVPVSIVAGGRSKSYLLALQTIPDGGPEGLTPYDAIYTVGTYNEVVGGDALHVELVGSSFKNTFRYENVTEYGPQLESQDAAAGEGGSVDSSGTSTGASGGASGGASSAVGGASPRVGTPSSGIPSAPASRVSGQTEIIDITDSGHLVSRMMDPSQILLRRDQAKSGPIYITGSPVIVKFYEDPAHKAFDSRAHFTVQFCFKDSSNNDQPLAGSEFELTKADGKKEIARTSSTPDSSLGCLGFEEIFQFNWFDPDKYLVFKAKFKHRRSGQEIERFYAVNTYLDFFTFRDLGSKDDPWNFREHRLAVQHFNKRDVVHSRAFIDGAAHGTPKNRRFRVDRYLNLETIVPVTFMLEVKVARESGTFNASRTAPVPLPAGPVLVKAVLYNRVTNAAGVVTEQVQPFEWAGRKGYQIVHFTGGAIRAEFEVPVHSLEMMRARSRVVLQVLPLDPRKLPKDKTELQKRALNMTDAELDTLVAPIGSAIFPTFVAGFRIQEGGSYTFVASDFLQGKVPAPWDAFMKNKPSQEELTEIEPLLNVSVDSLLKKWIDQDTAYHARMAEQQKLTNVTKAFYSDFISIENEAKVLEKNPGASSGNTLLPQTNALEPFIIALNQPLPKYNVRATNKRPIDMSLYQMEKGFKKQDLVQLVRGQKQIDRPLAARLCSVYMNYFLPRASGVNIPLPDRIPGPAQAKAAGSLTERIANAAIGLRDAALGRGETQVRPLPVPADGPFGNEDQRTAWYTRCLVAVDANGPDDVFSIDRTLRVLEHEPLIRAKDNIGTCEASFGINSGTSYGQGSSESVGYSLSWDPLSMFGHGLDTVGRAMNTVGLRYMGAIPGILGVGFNIGYSKSDSTSVGRDSSWGQNVSMDMQQTELRLHLKEYEHCATIRMTPDFWQYRARTLENYSKGFDDERTKGMLMATARGLLFCEGQTPAEMGTDGKVYPKPLDVYEQYYAFSQSGLSGLRGDQNDPKNLPWLTQLRGVRDYTTFMKLVADEKSLKDARKQLNVLNLPFERFSQAYKTYSKLNPVLPGFHTFNPMKPRDPNVICQ